jgi:hypothetical protein
MVTMTPLQQKIEVFVVEPVKNNFREVDMQHCKEIIKSSNKQLAFK